MTKSQLIAQLEALRRDNAELSQRETEGDVPSVKRRLAVERVRAEAMAMRSSKDLLNVVGTMYEEMISLGVDSLGNTIRFVEEEEDGFHITGRYYAFNNPRKFSISTTEFAFDIPTSAVDALSGSSLTNFRCHRNQTGNWSLTARSSPA